PLVLSRQEVEDVLAEINNFKHRLVIMFIYPTGARVSECVNIKLTDIDSKRMQVNIQEGKGLKQRKVPLHGVLLGLLRQYYKNEKPQTYLFEGTKAGKPLGVPAVREICKKTRHKTPKITKQYTPHTFRHSFATHHLENGTNLLVIQRFPGHADLSNTLKYIHVQQLETKNIKNPLDFLANLPDLCKKKK
ncbi:MAG: tyrosine-type recombinase/integrase, partial [Bacteroidota bacterium]